MAATSASTRSTSPRSTPCSAAAARRSSVTTGATTATCSAVTCPRANAADSAGSCSSTRPLRTTCRACEGESRAWPRSQDCMFFSPSCFGAPASSAWRTVRAISAASRFCAACNPPSRCSSCGPDITVRSSSASASNAADNPSMTPPAGLDHLFEV
ncbi:MAG TPA: hypothetical protein VHF92_09625 [Geodermatophilus sp.]|nr:hypothetical protein [Geodermatophilus sp.]